jgi:hypothetical protein
VEERGQVLKGKRLQFGIKRDGVLRLLQPIVKIKKIEVNPSIN